MNLCLKYFVFITLKCSAVEETPETSTKLSVSRPDLIILAGHRHIVAHLVQPHPCVAVAGPGKCRQFSSVALFSQHPEGETCLSITNRFI